MKQKFKISLLENGIHSFNKGLEDFAHYEKERKQNDFKLKEAIIFLHHGIELLLKQVLINNGGEHLIFDNIGSETVKKIIDAKRKNISIFNLEKPVHTVTYLDAIQRVKAFVNSTKLTEELETRLKELNTLRNNIEHYGVETEKNKVENLLLKLKEPISQFFLDAGIVLGKDNIRKWLELEKELLVEVSKLKGGIFIKKAELKNGIVEIEYVGNFDDYKNIQQQTNLTKESFEIYWGTGDAVLKAICDGGVRLMKKLDAINEVRIRLPFRKSIYFLDLTKSEVEKFLGFSFNEIKSDWQNTFSNKYVYTREGREEFFKRFGKVEKIT